MCNLRALRPSKHPHPSKGELPPPGIEYRRVPDALDLFEGWPSVDEQLEIRYRSTKSKICLCMPAHRIDSIGVQSHEPLHVDVGRVQVDALSGSQSRTLTAVTKTVNSSSIPSAARSGAIAEVVSPAD